MEYSYRNGVVKLLNKKYTLLDKLVLDFLSRVDTQCVIVSGYVAILFGRSRSTEDIDIFIRDEGISKFATFYGKIVAGNKYYAINAENAAEAYDLMTVDKSSLRFAVKGTFDPNFEIKFARKETDFYSLDNAWIADLGKGAKIRISPMELEIAYKLYLGSEKDFDDAAHLFIIFKKILNMKMLRDFLKKLGIKAPIVKKILGEDI